MFLQVEVATEVVKNSFKTNPDTVFGVLVSILIAGVVFLSIGMWRLVKNHREDLKTTHLEHKKEMREIFEKHEKADAKKYDDMTRISGKMLEASTNMLNKLDELIRSK